jgi:hypothetical protein
MCCSLVFVLLYSEFIELTTIYRYKMVSRRVFQIELAPVSVTVIKYNKMHFVIQWGRLMGSQLMGSFGYWIKFNQIYWSHISLLYLIYVSSSFAYWCRSVNGITLGLAQSDPIKRLPRYLIKILVIPLSSINVDKFW